MKSATYVSFGAVAVKSRRTGPGPGRPDGSALVVKRCSERLAPQVPSWRISRATWSLPMSWPVVRAALVSLRRSLDGVVLLPEGLEL